MPKGALEEQEIRYVAKLARISLTDEEVARLQPQMSEVLAHIRELENHSFRDSAPNHVRDPILRTDTPIASLPRTIALAEAPSATGEEFRVPAVMKHGEG